MDTSNENLECTGVVDFYRGTVGKGFKEAKKKYFIILIRQEILIYSIKIIDLPVSPGFSS
jgi:hypothetical protein